jgi:maltooligosyltrehalose trehalohydrolase
MQEDRTTPPGAIYLGRGGDVCQFRVWAPRAHKVEIHLLGPRQQYIPLQPRPNGYHEGVLQGVPPGTLYTVRLDGHRDRPDPASRFQPQGVHGPSEVIDPTFDWHDQSWTGGPALADLVLYELHVGAFTTEGTFDAVIPHLDDLKDLGITALELMPVAQCPGKRNWGYDGVYLFAVQNSYGGPAGLKRLVDACHQRGLAVYLDVVYNHLGPEGNYLGEFGPYFTDQYRTPWGSHLNFDGRHSDEVRRFFLTNALYWLHDFHIDGLRLDAIDYIKDFSARPFLEELASVAHAEAARVGRRFVLIGETDRNDARLIRPVERGGVGLDAVWTDDFHHALHTLLTDEQQGYYQDFGRTEHLARAMREAFVYTGDYSPYRGRRHGVSAREEPSCRFVVYSQNHDQVGNRRVSERLSQLVSFDALKLAAATVILSPFVPLLFMGEEYGESAPFPFFIHHSNPGLVEAVRNGRRAEFAAFQWKGEMLDPQDEGTFHRARLQHHLRQQGHHQVLREFYKLLLVMRRSYPALSQGGSANQEVTCFDSERVLGVRRWQSDEVLFLGNYGIYATTVTLTLPSGDWIKVLDSSETRWLGPGNGPPDLAPCTGCLTLTLPARSVVLYHLGRLV